MIRKQQKLVCKHVLKFLRVQTQDNLSIDASHKSPNIIQFLHHLDLFKQFKNSEAEVNMKGIQVQKAGGTYDYVEDLVKPSPGKNQVLVKSLVTAINPV